MKTNKTLLMTGFTLFSIVLVLFLILDWIWFSLFMKGFATHQLSSLLRFTNNNHLDVNLFFALLAYFCMTVLYSFFLLPLLKNKTKSKVLGLSFIFGFLVFGVFDFTNAALFKNYSLVFVLVDSLWGGFLHFIVSSFVIFLKRV